MIYSGYVNRLVSELAALPGIGEKSAQRLAFHVLSLTDREAEALADSAAEYLLEGSLPECRLTVNAGNNVGHVIPQRISGTRSFTLSLRVRQPLSNVSIVVRQGEKEILRKKMRKALPAEMIQLPIRAEKLVDSADMEVYVE